MNLFLIPPLLYELLFEDTKYHLTFWTWFFHIISYNFILNNIFKNLLFTASYFGSYFILFGYISCLIINPYLEYDLVKKKRNGYTDFNLWFRSFYFHLLPVLIVEFSKIYFKFDIRGIYLYLCLPFTHLLYSKLNQSNLKSAYKIYIKTESNKNLKVNELSFIFIQVCILFFTILFTINKM
jgi:hypothetical protein